MAADDVKLFAASKPLTGVPPRIVLALQQKGFTVSVVKRIAF